MGAKRGGEWLASLFLEEEKGDRGVNIPSGRFWSIWRARSASWYGVSPNGKKVSPG